LSFYRKQLEDWLAQLDVRGSVLDIGGGQMNVKSRVRRWDAESYRVLDLPDWDLQTKWQNPPTADIVFCLETIEYVINPMTAFENIADCTKRTAYISAPLIYPHHNELELDALRYTETGLARLGAEFGLKLTNITYRLDKSGYLQKLYMADGMRMAKQYSNHNTTGFIMEFSK